PCWRTYSALRVRCVARLRASHSNGTRTTSSVIANSRRQPEGIDAHQSGNLDWTLHHRSDKSLTELAQMYNPCIRGWITYYSHFYSSSHRARGRRWSPLP